MEKNKKSKKKTVKELHTVLDENSIEDSDPKDKKYLKSLNKRLKTSEEKTISSRRIYEGKTEGKIDLLKPRVTIHRRKVKTEFQIPGPVEVEKEVIKTEEQDELPAPIEEEKVESSGPEFIEVKPKEIPKKEEKAEISEFEKTELPEEKDLKEKELPEWEPVNIEDEEIPDTTKEEVETELKEEREEVKEEIDTPVFMPVKQIEEEEEKEEIETAGIAREEPTVDQSEKINVFKDIKSIDDKTAVLLYDNGFTSIDDLMTTSLKDITRVKGIKKKQAKDIKKEIEEKSEWEPLEDEEEALEWAPLEEEITHEIEEEVELDTFRKTKIDAFKSVNSIDDKTAVLLYDNGVTSVNALKITPLKELTQIKGISKKLAKKIKNEVDVKLVEPTQLPPKTRKRKFSEDIIVDEELGEGEAESVEEKISKFKEKGDNPADVFRGINSVDEKVAGLLYENGVTSIETLTERSIGELTKIEGIKKKLAKQIKKEAKAFLDKAANDEQMKIEISNRDLAEWETIDAEGTSELKIKAYRHGDYTLYEKKIKTKNGKKRKIHFFSKGKPDDGVAIKMPKGYGVKENKKTGVPYLKKKK